MNTSNPPSKRALLHVRVWSIYLTLATALLYWFAFTRSDVSPILVLLALLGVFYLIGLWRLHSLGRWFALSLLFTHVFAPILYLVTKSISGTTLALAIFAAPIGIVGLIFFNRPAVKALFENHKSAI